MSDISNHYKPILDPIYDYQTCCSRDEAVEYLLGWSKNGVLRKDLVPDNARPEELELYDFSWRTLLSEERESAEAAYSNALVERLADDIITEKLIILKRCDVQIEKAHRFLCDIDDELAKREASKLRLDSYDIENQKSPHITIASLSDWAVEKYNIHISTSLPYPIDTEANQNNPAAISPIPELSKTKTQGLQITFALLVEAFARTTPKYHHEDGRPNVSSIAKELAEKYAKGLSGQSKEAITDRIEAAIVTKKEHS